MAKYANLSVKELKNIARNKISTAGITSRSEFYDQFYQLCCRCADCGLLDELLPSKNVSYGKMSDEKLTEMAREIIEKNDIKNRTDLRAISGSLVSTCRKRGILDILLPLPKRKPKPKTSPRVNYSNRADDELVTLGLKFVEANRIVQRETFFKKASGLASELRRRKLMNQVLASQRRRATSYSEEELREICEGKTAFEVQRNHTGVYNLLREHPQLQHRVAPHLPKHVDAERTVEKSLASARKYENRTDFQRGDFMDYSFLLSTNQIHLLDEILPSRLNPKYTFDALFELMKSCDDYSDFVFLKNGSPYNVALRNGWLEKLIEQSGVKRQQKGAFNPERPALVYYLRIDDEEYGELFKIGVTNHSVEKRYGMAADRAKITNYWIIDEFDSGWNALRLETEVRDTYTAHKFQGPNTILIGKGATEMFTRDVLEKSEYYSDYLS